MTDPDANENEEPDAPDELPLDDAPEEEGDDRKAERKGKDDDAV